MLLNRGNFPFKQEHSPQFLKREGKKPNKKLRLFVQTEVFFE